MSLLESERARELLERAGLGALSPQAVRGVLVLSALVVGVALWRFWPASPAPELSFDQGASAQPDAGADVSAPEPDVVVHVAGAVMHPGVYALPAGSRVTHAIEAAGGPLGEAALNSLNLARVLADGEQVYVASTDEVASGAGPSSPGSAASSTPARIDINRASASELEALPGVGPATAQKIVQDREVNGPFKVPEDLMRVPGIGAKKFEAMKDFVSCG